MESIIQSIGSGIIITEMNDTITYINRAGERILGYSKQELLGKPFSIFGLREKQSAIPSFLNNPDDLDTRKEGWMKRKFSGKWRNWRRSTAANPIMSTLRYFRDEYEAHSATSEMNMKPILMRKNARRRSARRNHL
jgi:PAS domain S-box-containing protein